MILKERGEVVVRSVGALPCLAYVMASPALCAGSSAVCVAVLPRPLPALSFGRRRDEMETEERDNTASREQSEIMSAVPSETNEKDKSGEGSAETKQKGNPVNEPGEAEHSEKNDENSVSAEREVIPEVTVVLIGDTNSIEIGSKNILVDNDEQENVQQFSSKLYDLCGRDISVVNMLGQQNIDTLPLYQGIHAFLLLLPNGPHKSHYRSGVQWLEKAFGKGSLAYLMTVVTHESDEKCENALTDLKGNSSFDEKRYHTCRRSMMDEKEIIALLGKIDAMVSENDHHGYSELMFDENKEQKRHLDRKSEEEERMDSKVFQQIQTVRSSE
ncbi:uncharacterized protein ABDE67_000780 [Symphorus nematophorus]